jgi:hypothetical protein
MKQIHSQLSQRNVRSQQLASLARVFDSMNAIRFVRVFLSARLNRQHSGELQGSAPPFIVTGSYIDTRLSEDASSGFVVNTLNAATVPCLHVNIDMTKCCLSSRYPPVDSTNDSTVLRMFPMVRSPSGSDGSVCPNALFEIPQVCSMRGRGSSSLVAVGSVGRCVSVGVFVLWFLLSHSESSFASNVTMDGTDAVRDVTMCGVSTMSEPNNRCAGPVNRDRGSPRITLTLTGLIRKRTVWYATVCP